MIQKNIVRQFTAIFLLIVALSGLVALFSTLHVAHQNDVSRVVATVTDKIDTGFQQSRRIIYLEYTFQYEGKNFTGGDSRTFYLEESSVQMLRVFANASQIPIFFLKSDPSENSFDEFVVLMQQNYIVGLVLFSVFLFGALVFAILFTVHKFNYDETAKNEVAMEGQTVA